MPRAPISPRKILLILFFTVLIDMLGIGILVPVFPILVTPHSKFIITPDSWSTAQGFIMGGWLMAAFPLTQFLATPILGQLADKFGRRKLLAISIGGTALSYILFAIAIIYKNIPLMFFSRILDGASGGNISVAQAVIGDISKEASRAKNFGLIGMALGLGFILGPFIGGKLSDPNVVSWFNAATPFWFAALISFINILLVVFLLPETLAQISNKQVDISKAFRNIYKAFTVGQLRQIIPAIFLFSAGFTFFTTFFGVILAYQFDFNQSQIGNFYAYLGIMVVLAQGAVFRRLSGKVTDYKVLYVSIIAAGVCLGLYYFVPRQHIYLIYYITPFLAIGVALTKAFNVALISRITPNIALGEAMGINSSAQALAQAIPAILAGYIAANSTILPTLFGGITTICGGLLFICMYKQNRIQDC